MLIIGDALIDIFLFLKNVNEHCHANEETHEICFISGAKIPVDDCQFMLGGNACNVSVALSRLGINAALVAETGDDEFAQKILTGLTQENVHLDFFKQTPDTQASFAIDLTILNDRTIFSRHVKRKHDMQFENAQVAYVYLTSLGEEWKPLYERALDYVKKTQTKLIFNPGSRQLKEGEQYFETILQVTELLCINKEEAEDILYGHDQNIADELKKPEKLLTELQKLGPKQISMTDGSNGAYAIDTTGTIFFQGTVPSNSVQKTGVGDAYASGLLGALFNGKNMQEAMLWGAINSASVMEHIGSQPGLLTKQKLEERIKSLNH